MTFGKGNQVCPRFIKKIELELELWGRWLGYACKVDIEKF